MYTKSVAHRSDPNRNIQIDSKGIWINLRNTISGKWCGNDTKMTNMKGLHISNSKAAYSKSNGHIGLSIQ